MLWTALILVLIWRVSNPDFKGILGTWNSSFRCGLPLVPTRGSRTCWVAGGHQHEAAWWRGYTGGSPAKLWVPHPWRCSTLGWMRLGANHSSGRCSCPQWTSWNMVILKVPSSSNHSIILELWVPPNLMPKSLKYVGWLFSKIRVLPGVFRFATKGILNLRQSWHLEK